MNLKSDYLLSTTYVISLLTPAPLLVERRGCRVGKLPGISDDFLRQLQSGSGVQCANFVLGKSHPNPVPSEGRGDPLVGDAGATRSGSWPMGRSEKNRRLLSFQEQESTLNERRDRKADCFVIKGSDLGQCGQFAE